MEELRKPIGITVIQERIALDDIFLEVKVVS